MFTLRNILLIAMLIIGIVLILLGLIVIGSYFLTDAITLSSLLQSLYWIVVGMICIATFKNIGIEKEGH